MNKGFKVVLTFWSEAIIFLSVLFGVARLANHNTLAFLISLILLMSFGVYIVHND